MRPVVIIPAPTEPVAVDVTAWTLGVCFSLGIVGAIGSVVCCARILGWM